MNAPVLTTLTSAIALSSVVLLAGQTQPPPKAYDDVIAFATAAAAAAPERTKVGSLGKLGGKDVPLVVVGNNLADTTPAAVKASGKLRIWVQAASREGTDAALMLLKDMAAGKNELWLSAIVLLVSPTEIGDPTRQQSGREYVFLETPEAATLAKALADYDPHVGIEIRTEDGPCSAYAVTFAPPMNPNTSEYILGTLREEYLPFIVRSLKTKWSMDAFYRGKVVDGDDGCTPKPAEKIAATPAGPGRRGAAPTAAGRGRATGRGTVPTPGSEPQQAAWQASGYQLGLAANYLGVRNRFSVVGVVHAKDAPADRAAAAGHFLEEALAFAWGANTRLKKATEAADLGVLVGRSLPTSTRLATIGQVEVLMSDAASSGDAGAPKKRTSASRVVSMRDQLHFEPASDEIVAAEYFVPASQAAVVELLKKHGVQLRQLTQGTKGAEEFVVTPAPAGSTPARIAGTWQRSTAEVPSGSWAVRMNQPLSRLAFALLEPTSEDSVATLPGVVTDGKIYSILRRGR